MTEKSFDEAALAARFRDFDENFKRVRQTAAEAAVAAGRRPEDVQILAATKTVPVELINYAAAHGLRLMGENKVQELLEKYNDLAFDRDQIHFIGHLQTNKVRQIVGKVHMIQSVDSLKLAEEIDKRSAAAGCVTNVLVEVNAGGEESKSGVAPAATEELVCQVAQLPHLRIQGLMTIPPVTEKPEQARKFFSNIYQLSVDIRRKNIDNVSMDCLSMGMSADYPFAILEGATMVRIGSLLFGKRHY